MKHKTDELEGVALDYCVGVALGLTLENPMTAWMNVAGEYGPAGHGGREPLPWKPSTDWGQGGPIIERERISVTWPDAEPQIGYEWSANIARPEASWNCDGPTPLIAAMRAFVKSKLGDEVELP